MIYFLEAEGSFFGVAAESNFRSLEVASFGFLGLLPVVLATG